MYVYTSSILLQSLFIKTPIARKKAYERNKRYIQRKHSCSIDREEEIIGEKERYNTTKTKYRNGIYNNPTYNRIAI